MSRRAGRALVAVYGAAVALALFWPDGWPVNRFFVGVYVVGMRLGVSGMRPEDYSTLANAIAFAPLAYGLVVGWPRVRPWLWALALVGLSCTAELVQRDLARHSSVRDVLLNSAGVLLGAGLGSRRVRRVSEPSARLEP